MNLKYKKIKTQTIFTLFIFLFNLANFTFAQTNKIDEKTKPLISSQKNKSVRILEKPKAAYPKSDTGTVCIQGNVRLKVQFLETGEIGEIQVVSGLPYGATENAIEAAKKIKFLPAVKDGKPITSAKIVTYNFAIY